MNYESFLKEMERKGWEQFAALVRSDIEWGDGWDGSPRVGTTIELRMPRSFIVTGEQA